MRDSFEFAHIQTGNNKSDEQKTLTVYLETQQEVDDGMVDASKEDSDATAGAIFQILLHLHIVHKQD